MQKHIVWPPHKEAGKKSDSKLIVLHDRPCCVTKVRVRWGLKQEGLEDVQLMRHREKEQGIQGQTDRGRGRFGCLL